MEVELVYRLYISAKQKDYDKVNRAKFRGTLVASFGVILAQVWAVRSLSPSKS